MWDDVRIKDSGQRWELLPENGWFALLAWTAGLNHVSRAAHDRASADDPVNEFLLEAGVPARPVGFDWFLRIPDRWPVELSLADELGSQITRAWPNDTHPAALLPLFERVVHGFYSDTSH